MMSFDFWRSLRRLGRNDRGSVHILFVASALPLVAAVGSAVDYSNVVKTRSIAWSALDTATLSTARAISTREISPDNASIYLSDLFDSTVRANGIDPDTFNPPNVSFDDEVGEVSASIDGSVDTDLMGAIGIDQMDIAISSSARFAQDLVELAVVVDVTGSMRGSRIRALKEAAEDLVEMLLDNNPSTDDGVRIALIPYSQGVGAGEYWSAMYGYYNGAQIAKLGEFDIGANSNSRRCFTERDNGVIGDYAPDSAVYGTTENASCPRQSIIPLTQDRGALLDAIDDLSASGATAGHVGLQWGWNMISPKWGEFWPEESRPAEYDAEDTKKIIIMMTDGQFNTYYDNQRGEADHHYRSPNDRRTSHNWGWYWNHQHIVADRPDFGFPVQEENYGDSGDEAESERRAQLWCDQIRDANIEHYTIAFEAPRSSETLMRECATDEEYFFDADTSQELIDAFRIIGGKVRSLYLSS